MELLQIIPQSFLSSIMSGKLLKIIFLAWILLTPLVVEAETKPSKDTTAQFRIGVDFAGGYAYRLRTANTLPGNYTRGGFAANVRVKWGSGNIFGAGVETGFLPISSLSASGASTALGTTDIEASLSAVPTLFIVALQRYNVQLHGGFGYYRVSATATVFESTIESSEWDFGYMVALGYAYPLSSAVKVGAEVKWNNISEVQISLLSLQARLLIKLWEW
ncbi:MAG: hypothetical protein C0417_03410 [Chlorobiaceae bacterium]|nr:hypothetical protein [Chlorobiaceae bacterium]